MSKEPALRVGRPRASPHEATRPVREEILQAARVLFREKGFTGTTTRDIASAVGLRQPSLFHYFKNKEAIFRTIVLDTVEPVLEFLKQERARRQNTATALYRIIWFDTFHLCTNENVHGSPVRFHEMTRDRFPEFWDLRDDIINAYRKLIRKGARDGVFLIDDLEITTSLIFGLGESTITWYLPDAKKHSPERVADVAANIGLKALLADTTQIRTIVAESETPLRHAAKRWNYPLN